MGQTVSNSVVNRFEGRLFLEDGRLCMVVEADEARGLGRVSSRVDGQPKVVEMSLNDIGQRLSMSAKMTLDSIGAATTTQRVQQKSDGWYFSSREGLVGPFSSNDEAQQELTGYLLTSQSA